MASSNKGTQSSAIQEEAFSIARRLPLSHEEWLTANPRPTDAWCPPRIAMSFLRIGLIEADDMEGGYRLTELGEAVRALAAEATQ